MELLNGPRIVRAKLDDHIVKRRRRAVPLGLSQIGRRCEERIVVPSGVGRCRRGFPEQSC